MFRDMYTFYWSPQFRQAYNLPGISKWIQNIVILESLKNCLIPESLSPLASQHFVKSLFTSVFGILKITSFHRKTWKFTLKRLQKAQILIVFSGKFIVGL